MDVESVQGERSTDALHAAGYGPPGGPPPGGGGGGYPPGGGYPGGPPGFGGPPPGGGGYGPPGGAPPGGYGPPPGGYGPPPMGGGGFPPPAMGYGPPQGGSTSGLAIASMITGIISPLACCCQPVSGPLAICALTMGIISLTKIRASHGNLRGGGMAIAGIVLGSIGILMTLIGLLSTFDESLRNEYGGSFR